MTDPFSQTEILNDCLERLKAGDADARERILSLSIDRLVHLVRKMKKSFPRVARWEQTDDIFQNAAMRLYGAMEEVEIENARHFYRLAALHFRRELIDLARHYQGPQGMGKNHHTMGVKQNWENDDGVAPAFDPGGMTQEPQQIAKWSEFHAEIEKLPEAERDVFDLIWYHDMTQEEAAKVLDVSVRQIKRRWRSARLLLHEQLKGDLPNI